ncbi:DUF6933 domain-containing protein [Nonomuraea sp. NPDC059194]|uniref:DUF6933 domain-containing protein n=1 Tax=Nonomuraea sp. NPDC059194 TaxID=3346764 RepID=UPI00367E106D
MISGCLLCARPRSSSTASARPTSTRPSNPAHSWWYATVLFWRPQVALFVNEPTLLPVLMPLAPGATLLERFPSTVAAVLAMHGAPQPIIDDEMHRMREKRLAKTTNRSVTGVMTEFARLAEFYREGTSELPELARRLARVPCGPLYKRHVSPDREFDAFLRSITPANG